MIGHQFRLLKDSIFIKHHYLIFYITLPINIIDIVTDLIQIVYNSFKYLICKEGNRTWTNL